MKEAIKAYLEEAIKNDEALAKVYDESKLNACISYINEQARKELKGKNGAIKDDVVYHWARDFYFGDLNKAAEPAEFKTDEEAHASEDAGNISEPTTPAPEKKLVITDVIQDEPKGTITMDEVDAIRGKKKKAKKQKEDPVDDGQLMFDFGA